MSAISILLAAVLFVIGFINLVRLLRDKHFWFGLIYQILLFFLIIAVGIVLKNLNVSLNQNSFFLFSYVLLSEILLLNVSKDSRLPIRFLFSFLTLGLFTFITARNWNSNGNGTVAHVYNPNKKQGEDNDPRLNRLYVRSLMDMSLFWISWTVLFIYWGKIFQPFYLGLIDSILCFLIAITCYSKAQRKATLPLSKYISWLSVIFCLIFLFVATNVSGKTDIQKKVISTTQNIMQNK